MRGPVEEFVADRNKRLQLVGTEQHTRKPPPRATGKLGRSYSKVRFLSFKPTCLLTLNSHVAKLAKLTSRALKTLSANSMSQLCKFFRVCEKL